SRRAGDQPCGAGAGRHAVLPQQPLRPAKRRPAGVLAPEPRRTGPGGIGPAVGTSPGRRVATMSEDLIQSSRGTPWSAWQQSAHLARATWLDPRQLCPPGRRLVLIAPHPDDEILMAGGLLTGFKGRE